MNLWHLLRGKVQESLQTASTVECPLCHAGVESAREPLVTWDAKHMRFSVLHNAQCVSCHYDFPISVKTVPLELAPRAACACGALLFLTGHTMQQTPEELTCEVTYVCSACTRRKRVVVGKLKRLLTKRGDHIAHIAIGPAGMQEVLGAAAEATYPSGLVPARG